MSEEFLIKEFEYVADKLDLTNPNYKRYLMKTSHLEIIILKIKLLI